MDCQRFCEADKVTLRLVTREQCTRKVFSPAINVNERGAYSIDSRAHQAMCAQGQSVFVLA